MRHVVWDWNGTLFDDLEVVIRAVNSGLAAFDQGPITLDDYRDHYTRPVYVFYERIFGREVSKAEWDQLDQLFHDAYRAMLDDARLAGTATEALDQVKQSGWSQSLLSMFPHEELVPLVERLEIADYLDPIDGLRGKSGKEKADYLEDHMTSLFGALHLDASEVLVVGDTPDDVAAARHVGAPVVLVDSGGHHRMELEILDVPVAQTLVEALRLGGFS